MKEFVVGLCGKAGSGKDTAAAALMNRLGFHRAGFSDPLYSGLSAVTGMSIESLMDRRQKEAPLPIFKKSPRQMLQTLGTDWGRDMIRDTIWVEVCMSKCTRLFESGVPGVVIPDVRFENEALAIRKRGGLVINITRGDAPCIEKPSSMHKSEDGIPENLIDLEVENDGPVSHLSNAILAIAQSYMNLQETT